MNYNACKIYCPRCQRRLGPLDVKHLHSQIMAAQGASVCGVAAHERAKTAAAARWAKYRAGKQGEK